MATIDDIISRAQQVRDNTAIGSNTATLVGGVMTDTAEHLQDAESDISTLKTKVNTTTQKAETALNLAEELSEEGRYIIEGNVTNNPDEVTLTSEDDKLQLKNRRYLASVGGVQGQMGYIILAKGQTFKQQIEAISEGNTIFEIRYDYDLGGGSVTIPENCTLKFEGGSLSNGSIVFNNTLLSGDVKCLCTVQGSVANSDIYADWFIDGNDISDFVQMLGNVIVNENNALNNIPSPLLTGYNRLFFSPNKTYTKSCNVEFQGLKDIVIDGSCSILTYIGSGNRSILSFTDCVGLTIKNFSVNAYANGTSDGTIKWHNINLTRCKNTTIKDIDSLNAFADGIRVDACDNLRVENLRCNGYGRNGISFICGKNAQFVNCETQSEYYISAHGVHLSVDVEPNSESLMNLENICFRNCLFIGAPVSVRTAAKVTGAISVTYDNCTFENSAIRGGFINGKSTGSMVFSTCSFNNCSQHAIWLRTACGDDAPLWIFNSCVIHNVNTSNTANSYCYPAIALLDDNSASALNADMGNIVINGLTIIQDKVDAVPYYGMQKIFDFSPGSYHDDNLDEDVQYDIKNVRLYDIRRIDANLDINSYSFKLYPHKFLQKASKEIDGCSCSGIFEPITLTSVPAIIQASDYYNININTTTQGFSNKFPFDCGFDMHFAVKDGLVVTSLFDPTNKPFVYNEGYAYSTQVTFDSGDKIRGDFWVTYDVARNKGVVTAVTGNVTDSSGKRLTDAANGVKGATDSWKPTYKNGTNYGKVFFSTTSGKPLWWNGTAWVDATGTVVS